MAPAPAARRLALYVDGALYRAYDVEIPAVVREIPDEAAIAMALIENIQRKNLNPLEESRSLDRLLILGVHTNMCVLHRSFGIKQMVKWGVNIALVRDLTDTMYNPASRPYVSHAAGTQLVVSYIEQFWCPTVDSTDLLS